MRMFVFFKVLAWAWKGWEIEFDVMPPDEKGNLIGMKIVIGEYAEDTDD